MNGVRRPGTAGQYSDAVLEAAPVSLPLGEGGSHLRTAGVPDADEGEPDRVVARPYSRPGSAATCPIRIDRYRLSRATLMVLFRWAVIRCAYRSSASTLANPQTGQPCRSATAVELRSATAAARPSLSVASGAVASDSSVGGRRNRQSWSVGGNIRVDVLVEGEKAFLGGF